MALLTCVNAASAPIVLLSADSSGFCAESVQSRQIMHATVTTAACLGQSCCRTTTAFCCHVALFCCRVPLSMQESQIAESSTALGQHSSQQPFNALIFRTHNKLPLCLHWCTVCDVTFCNMGVCRISVSSNCICGYTPGNPTAQPMCVRLCCRSILRWIG